MSELSCGAVPFYPCALAQESRPQQQADGEPGSSAANPLASWRLCFPMSPEIGEDIGESREGGRGEKQRGAGAGNRAYVQMRLLVGWSSPSRKSKQFPS